MDTTRASLLIRIRNPDDEVAWNEFYELYSPLLYRFGRARGLTHDDAEEVCGTCLEAIVRKIGDFQYDQRKGGFKAWLRTMVNRRVIDKLRKRRENQADTRALREVEDSGSNPDELWERHWEQQHLRYCLDQIRGEVAEQTFEAFRLLMDEEMTVPEICAKLQINRNQVYKAKARILNLVRDRLNVLYALTPDGESPDEPTTRPP